MSNRLTLEGDENETLPEDLQILRAYGKFIPTQELQGDELLGDFVLEGFEYFSPSESQLSGEDSPNLIHLGNYIHDDAYSIALSGNELAGFNIGGLFKGGFKLPSFGGFKLPKIPNIRIKAPNIGKAFKGVTKGISSATKQVAKAGKNIVKAHGKMLKDAGKAVGQLAQGGMEVLQAMGQGGGEAPMQEEEQAPEEEPIQEEVYQEESFIEEEPVYEESEEVFEEAGGELGFFPQMAAVQSGVQGITSIVGALDARNERKAKLKSDAKIAQINALSNIFKPQQAAQPVRRAVSPNPSFSKPAVSKTSEGKLSVSYRSNDAGGNTPETKPTDNKMLMYGGIAVAIAVVLFIAFKGK
ncbi:hypothetical protein AB3N59_18720 [Leptospira sp. WS92.C1]